MTDHAGAADPGPQRLTGDAGPGPQRRSGGEGLAPQRLTGSVAIVTGASRGIGLAIAGSLFREGCKVYMVGRDLHRLEDAVATVTRPGAGAEGVAERPGMGAEGAAERPVPIVADLATSEGVERLLAAFSQERLDILVNNAGYARSLPLEETSDEEWRRHFSLNVDAPFRLIRGLMGKLRNGRNPAVVNIGSVVSTKGYKGQGAYTASKHALLGLTKVFARELHRDGIRLFSVEPGGVATDMIRTMRPDIDERSLTTPDEVAETVLHLLLLTGGAMIDQVQIRRAGKEPWQ